MTMPRYLPVYFGKELGSCDVIQLSAPISGRISRARNQRLNLIQNLQCTRPDPSVSLAALGSCKTGPVTARALFRSHRKVGSRYRPLGHNSVRTILSLRYGPRDDKSIPASGTRSYRSGPVCHLPQVIGENIANLGLTNSRRCDDV